MHKFQCIVRDTKNKCNKQQIALKKNTKINKKTTDKVLRHKAQFDEKENGIGNEKETQHSYLQSYEQLFKQDLQYINKYMAKLNIIPSKIDCKGEDAIKEGHIFSMHFVFIRL